MSKKGYNYFVLDNIDYTPFPSEEEVLINTDCEFEIVDISED